MASTVLLTTLTLVNGITNEIEKWNGVGAVSIMLEEIAGYKNSTDFGWYNTDHNSISGEIFDGPVSPGRPLGNSINNLR